MAESSSKCPKKLNPIGNPETEMVPIIDNRKLYR